MKRICLCILFLLVICSKVEAQSTAPTTTLTEWSVQNTGSNTGDRIVVTVNQDTTVSASAAEIVGQIIDANGNYTGMPTVANFKLYITFHPGTLTYQLIQDVSTSNITLALKSLSATQIALVATLPVANKQMRVFYRFNCGLGTSLTPGNPSTVVSSGAFIQTLVAQPTYQSLFTGTLGINTTDTKGYQLAINGSAIATSFTVKAYGSWPDYVFKPSYHLTPLSEVKTYVDLNHHLPEIPSEKEIATNGLNLGDIDRLLTKKVEELTLYLIEKDKQLNDEKNIINAQEAKIDAQETINKKLSEQLKSQQAQIDELKAMFKNQK